MTAGSVSAPLIIPIVNLQTHRNKNHIDTSTPVSLHSESPEVQIFFTLDGSRPVGGQRGSSGSRKYSAPILLPAGRVAVRAVAVARDGRQSSTVTKVFSVGLVDSEDRRQSGEDFLRSDQQPQTEAESSARPAEPRIVGNGSPPPRFLSGRFGGAAPKPPRQGPRETETLSSTQASRVLRETGYLRCPQCLSLRPSDPLSSFCPDCGASLPVLPGPRLPPAEGAQVLCCGFCHSVVPVNTHSCLICEASIQPQLHTQSLQDRVVCVCCGGVNPAHVCSCLICESRLQGSSAPSVRSAGSRELTCSRCKRVNRGDARFCDWCGSKPGHAASCVVCWRCGASGHPYAFHCTACGAFLEAPPPPTSCSDITRPAGGASADQATPTSHEATWQATPSPGPAPRTKLATPTAEQSTQTAGLYYPSATELQRKEQQRATRERQPLLTAISPGRGFWRKQLDHVCAHLRSYAQNHAPFRALLGEPRLGRVVSAVIQEDRYEVSVTVSFVSAGREQQGPAVGAATTTTTTTAAAAAAGRTESLSSVTERSDSCRSERSTAVQRRTKQDQTPKPPVCDVRLLGALGPGRGQVDVVQQLLDQGADPSCCGADGRHALAVAVMNGHHDVLPVLVQRGAAVDQQSGRLKNSALHEAAAQGAAGLQSAALLLSCGAGVAQRNGGGLTACDVALTSGCSDMVSLLAARAGLDLLGTLGKPKLNLEAS